MKILFVTKGCPDSGNFGTVNRIRHFLCYKYASLSIEVIDCYDSSQNILTSFKESFKKFSPDLIVGLHLYRCHFLSSAELKVPYILICGGTDLNEDSQHPTRLCKMQNVLLGAKGCVVFGQSMYNSLLKIMPEKISKLPIHVVPQGVFLAHQIDKTQSVVERYLGSKVSDYFLVMGRLRSVKDPTFILHPFLDWCETHTRQRLDLVYLGSVEEHNDEIQVLLNYAKKNSRIHHIESVPHLQSQSLLSSALGLINCSRSEGQSLVILEALALETPVIARNIPGNADLISHGINGLLFDSEKSFQSCLTTLVTDKSLRRSITVNGKSFINTFHSSYYEADQYYNIFKSFE